MLYLIFFFVLILIFFGGLSLWFSRKKFRETNARFNRLERLIWETSALNGLLAGQQLLPRPGGWAASTDILYELARLVQVKEPKLIVELGSGLSTIVLATAAKHYGGRIVSIDHDADFAIQTQKEIERHGLQDRVEIRVAPIKKQNIENESREWYDIGLLADLKNVDLVFVDGPPAIIREDIRKPALSFFWDRLSDGGQIVLDDVGRMGEQKIIADWKKQHANAALKEIEAEKGALIVTRTMEKS